MKLLVQEQYHAAAENNHGALWYIHKAFDSRGRCIGKCASFMGNVVCADLQNYLRENPGIEVASKLPQDVLIEHNG